MHPFQRSRFSFGTHRNHSFFQTAPLSPPRKCFGTSCPEVGGFFQNTAPPGFARKRLCFVEKKHRRGRQNTSCDCVFIFFEKIHLTSSSQKVVFKTNLGFTCLEFPTKFDIFLRWFSRWVMHHWYKKIRQKSRYPR